MKVNYVTPHTFHVAEISYVEWYAAFLAYQSAKSAK